MLHTLVVVPPEYQLETVPSWKIPRDRFDAVVTPVFSRCRRSADLNSFFLPCHLCFFIFLKLAFVFIMYNRF